MELTSVIAGRLLKKLEATQPYNVVIINAEGMIVGATDERIVGTRHEHAAQRLEEYRERFRETSGLKGALPVKERGNGRCLFAHNQLVGAIGLSGREEQVTPYLEMAKAIAELLLEQEIGIQNEGVQKAPQTQILMRLLSQHKNKAKLKGALETHGIDIGTPHTLLAVQFAPLAERGDSRESTGMELLFQNAFSNACSLFRRRFSFAGDLIFQDEKNATVFVVCADRSYVPEQNEQKIFQICQLIVEDARLHYRLSAKAVIGKRCRCLDDYDGQYYQLMETLRVGADMFPGLPVLQGKSLVLGNITSYIPKDTKKTIVEYTFGNLLKSPQKEMYLETLAEYFKNSLNTGETARNLYIHRNTLQHRFKKIEELTGYCVYNVDDLFTLRLALMLYGIQDP